jgi:hypothetical protein
VMGEIKQIRILSLKSLIVASFAFGIQKKFL